MKVAAVILALALGGAAISCSAKPPYGIAHLSAKYIEVPDGSCSATAVGAYVLLSASHCFEGDVRAIVVDGKRCDVWKLVHDGNDHVLVTLGHACFQRYTAKLGRAPKVGDELFVWGNPGAFQDLLRICKVAGKVLMPKEAREEWPSLRQPATLLTGALGKGDSGAGVFNARGELVGVVSFGTMHYTYPPNLFTGMLPLAFKEWP